MKVEAGAVCGIPDIIGCVHGLFISIELKQSSKHKPSKLQAHNLELIRFAGGLSFVAYPENAEWVLAQLMKIKPRRLRVN